MNQLSMRKSLRAMSVVFVASLAFAAHGSVNVFDDAVFWFRGGKDKNGNGYMQQGEFFDDLHANDASHANHWMPMTGFSQNAEIRAEQVIFPALGISKSMQVLHLDNKRGFINEVAKWHPVSITPHGIFSDNKISNEYTIVSRLRLDNLDRMECLFRIGYNESLKQGMVLGLQQHSTATKCKYITGFCTASSGSANKQFKLEQLLVPTNTWVDVAVVVGNGKLRVGVAAPESLASPNVNHTIAFAETSMWTGNCPLLDDPSYYKLFHLNGQDDPEESASVAKYFFVGSVQQLAIWGRALSDQEVMAAFGMPRPAIFRTGFDNGASGEFGGTRTGSTQTIDGLGSWQNIANTMKGGDTWTVNFNALRDEASLAQIFSVKTLPGSATSRIEPTLNGISLGEVLVGKDAHAFWPVATNLVHEGQNTLVIVRKDGGTRDFLVDAMELGGSLGVGSANNTADDGRVLPEIIATGVPSAADPNPAHWPKGIQPYLYNTNFNFRAWVDPEVVGACASRFWTCVQCKKAPGATGTVKKTDYFTVFVNQEAMTNVYANQEWVYIALDLTPDVLHGGWNDFEIRSAAAYQTLYWQFDRYRFETVLPSAFSFPMPLGMSVIIK